MALSFDSAITDVQILPADVSPRPDAQRVEWLVPGFINAHCHLEYSWLGAARQATPANPPTMPDIPLLPRGPIPFGQWMEAIMAARPVSPADLERQSAAMADGAQALLQGGCTTVIDSTTDGSSSKHLDQAALRHFLFHEVLGLSRERAEPIWRRAIAHFGAPPGTEASPWLIGMGINPHAPYSVGPWLRRSLCGENVSGVPQAWHLAETPDEEQLFLEGKGSIADFLETRGMTPPWDLDGSKWSGRSPGVSSYQFLESEGLLPHCQVAFHGNALTASQASFFSGERALVHCPATHRWFQRPPAPLSQWLNAGANICLGTDSLASSDTLSMLDIIRITLQENPALSADDVLQMACTNPAKISFMRSSGITGQIKPGSPADFVAVRPDGPVQDWHSMLTHPNTQVEHVWVSGQTRR